LEEEGFALIENQLADETVPEESLRLVKSSCIWRGNRTKRRRDQGFDQAARYNTAEEEHPELRIELLRASRI